MTVDQTEKLKALALAATPGPWKWWTSNSTLRLTGADGRDGGVLYGYVHSGDGDVMCSDENRAFIEASNPAAVLELIAEVERLRAVMKQAASGYESGFFSSGPNDIDGRFSLNYGTPKEAEVAFIALTTEIEAGLHAGAARQGGGTSENMVVDKQAENDAKTAETRMGSGFDGGGQISAPAAGTEKDAAQYRLLTRGDLIQLGDEFLSDDCASWLTDPSGIFAGLEYLPGALKTARRKVAAIGAHPKPCRNEIINSGALAIPKSCPRCGLAKDCPAGVVVRARADAGKEPA